MNYPTQLIQTAADCDALLIEISKIKRNLVFRQYSANRQVNIMLIDAANLPNKLVTLDQEVTGLTTAHNISTPGPKKDEFQQKINVKGVKRRALVDKIEKRGPVATLKKQYGQEFIEEQLLEVDLYETAVTNRKTELAALVPTV